MAPVNDAPLPARLNPVLDSYGLRLRDAGQAPFIDAFVEVPSESGPRHLAVVASLLKDPDTKPHDLLFLNRHHQDGILVVEKRLTRDKAARYRELGLFHLDLAGNGWIDLPGFKLWVEGRRDLASAPQRTTGDARRSNRAFTPTGARLVFILLVEPSLASAPLRALADLSGISIGAASAAIHGLIDDGHLQQDDPQRRLQAKPYLVAKWIESFRTRLQPSLRTVGFEGPSPVEIRTFIQRTDANLVIAGEAISNHTHGAQTTTLYAPTPWSSTIRELHLRRSTTEPNVWIREKFWRDDLLEDATSSPLAGQIAPTLLTAAELIASGEPRQQEAGRLELRAAGLELPE